MKWTSQFTFIQLLLFPITLMGLNHNNPSELIKKAEQLLTENLISDAFPIYESLCNTDSSFSKNMETHLLLRLASCYLSLKDPQSSLKILNSLKPQLEENSHHFYLLSIANRKLGHLTSAYSLINQCYSSSLTKDHSNHILFERGICSMLLGKNQEAILDFQNIQFNQQNPLVYYLAQFALLNIFQNNKQFADAYLITDKLKNSLPFHHPLFNKIAFFEAFLYLNDHKNTDAITCFKQVISSILCSRTSWPIDFQQKAVAGYLKAISKEPNPNKNDILFQEIDSILYTLLQRDPKNITSYLLIYDCCITQAQLNNEDQFYNRAKNIHLEIPNHLLSEFSTEIRLKQIELIPSFMKRMETYKELLENPTLSSMKKGTVWLSLGNYLLKRNDLSNDHQSSLTFNEITNAELAFRNAYQQFILANQPDLATISLRQQLYACLFEKSSEGYKRGWNLGCSILNEPNCKDSFEILALTSWIALKTSEASYIKKAKVYLEKVNNSASEKWILICRKIDILIHIYLKEWEIAKEKLNFLSSQIDNQDHNGEVWFWKGYCAEQLKDDALKKECYQKCWIDQKNEFSPFAYFRTYSLEEYFHGDRKAFNHLKKMPLLFPNHPLTIQAFYLIGLYHKTDHVKPNGQLINSKDLVKGCEAFVSAVNTFNELKQKGLIPCDDLLYYVKLRYLAQLEQGKINFNAAQQSNDLKREIYLEYSQEVFSSLIEAIDNQTIESIARDKTSAILSEAQFYLAKTFIQQGKDSKALPLFHALTMEIEPQKMTYWTIKAWYEKGILSQKNLDPENAIEHFNKAQDLAKNCPVINQEELLEILIEKSQSQKMLKKYEEAMKLLSDVINADVISSLRVKAMFLRAEIYELQGRHELALKQLKAASTKGGDWAKQAQIQLEKTYGY